MPYIGRGPAKSGAFRILDDISGDFNGSTTSFALEVGSAALTVGLPETLTISVDGVIQEPGSAYTISGSNIVFTAAPQADATFWGVELGDVGGLADRATTQSASNDSTKVATTAYVDNQIDVQLTAEDLDITGDSGTIAIDLDGEVLAITGGAGITTAATGNAVNIVGHVEAHTVASHSDTTGTGAELETLTDGSTTALHAHAGAADDTAYASSWNGVTAIPPSKNAVYDKIETMGGGATVEAIFFTRLADAASGAVTYSGAGGTPSGAIVVARSTTTASSLSIGVAEGDLTDHLTGYYAFDSTPVGISNSDQVVLAHNASGDAQQYGQMSAWTSTGGTITWVKVGSGEAVSGYIIWLR